MVLPIRPALVASTNATRALVLVVLLLASGLAVMPQASAAAAPPAPVELAVESVSSVVGWTPNTNGPAVTALATVDASAMNATGVNQQFLATVADFTTYDPDVGIRSVAVRMVGRVSTSAVSQSIEVAVPNGTAGGREGFQFLFTATNVYENRTLDVTGAFQYQRPWTVSDVNNLTLQVKSDGGSGQFSIDRLTVIVTQGPPQSCSDGELNQDEAGVDMFGVCGIPQPSGCTTTFAGFYGTYYVGENFQKQAFARNDPTINFVTNGWKSTPGFPAAAVSGFRTDEYSVHWFGYWNAPSSGNYTFATRSDDGARLWVDGQRVINKWVLQGPTTHSAVLNLTAGLHTIRMDFWEHNGGEVAQLFVRPGNTAYSSGANPLPDILQPAPMPDFLNGGPSCELDSDGDGFSDKAELAAGSNPNDRRSVPTDRDGDGVPNTSDRCADTPAGSAVNEAGCSIEQLTSRDSDGDGISDLLDTCPGTLPNARPVNATGCAANQRDTDGDGITDDRDTCANTPRGDGDVNATGCSSSQRDTDGDGINDRLDQCPMTRADAAGQNASFNATTGCGGYQRDTDRDGVTDDRDQCPATVGGAAVVDVHGCAPIQRDADLDGVPDDRDQCVGTRAGAGAPNATFNATTGCAAYQRDTDNDTVSDELDTCPNSVGRAVNATGCDPTQRDTDGDGVNDALDRCENTRNPPNGTLNATTGCDGMQTDSDGDSVPDLLDTCPETPAAASVNATGCAASETDSDNDGVTDDLDRCEATQGGNLTTGFNLTTGCAAYQRDTDNDGVTDDRDACPDTPASADIDETGCSPSQRDRDGDGVTDDRDHCSLTNTTVGLDANGCASNQRDADGDRIPDSLDQCPNTPVGAAVDVNGCAAVQRDTDGDGKTDDVDACPTVAANSSNGCKPAVRIVAQPSILLRTANPPAGVGVTPECSDGLDNDDDGLNNFTGGDPGCTGPNDNDERDLRVRAVLVDADGNEVPGNITWSIPRPVDGVSVTPNGTLEWSASDHRARSPTLVATSGSLRASVPVFWVAPPFVVDKPDTSDLPEHLASQNDTVVEEVPVTELDAPEGARERTYTRVIDADPGARINLTTDPATRGQEGAFLQQATFEANRSASNRISGLQLNVRTMLTESGGAPPEVNRTHLVEQLNQTAGRPTRAAVFIEVTGNFIGGRNLTHTELGEAIGSLQVIVCIPASHFTSNGLNPNDAWLIQYHDEDGDEPGESGPVLGPDGNATRIPLGTPTVLSCGYEYRPTFTSFSAFALMATPFVASPAPGGGGGGGGGAPRLPPVVAPVPPSVALPPSDATGTPAAQPPAPVPGDLRQVETGPASLWWWLLPLVALAIAVPLAYPKLQPLLAAWRPRIWVVAATQDEAKACAQRVRQGLRRARMTASEPNQEVPDGVDLVVCSLPLLGPQALQVVQALRKQTDVPILALVRPGDIAAGQAAVQAGASSFRYEKEDEQVVDEAKKLLQSSRSRDPSS